MIHKKAKYCIVCLWKLAKFYVDRSLLVWFYRSFTKSGWDFHLFAGISFLLSNGKTLTGKCVQQDQIQQRSLSLLHNKKLLKKAIHCATASLITRVSGPTL